MRTFRAIDTGLLMESSGGSRDMAAELLHLYFDLTGRELLRLEQASLDGNAETLRDVAHKCAGSSIACGMRPLAAALKDLEHAASLGLIDDAREKLEKVREEFGNARTEADDFLASTA